MEPFEIYKDIKWFEWKYKISNKWKIISYYKNRYISSNEKILKWHILKTWYKIISLDKKLYLVHRIVAQTFIKKIEWKNIVNHIDWNKLNNDASNLEWCTYSENNKHKYTLKWNESKLRKKVIQFDKEMNEIEIHDSIRSAANKIWKLHTHISQCCSWKRKTAFWYIWRFIW